MVELGRFEPLAGGRPTRLGAGTGASAKACTSTISGLSYPASARRFLEGLRRASYDGVALINVLCSSSQNTIAEGELDMPRF